jgi:hypothetical protein
MHDGHARCYSVSSTRTWKTYPCRTGTYDTYAVHVARPWGAQRIYIIRTRTYNVHMQVRVRSTVSYLHTRACIICKLIKIFLQYGQNSKKCYGPAGPPEARLVMCGLLCKHAHVYMHVYTCGYGHQKITLYDRVTVWNDVRWASLY